MIWQQEHQNEMEVEEEQELTKVEEVVNHHLIEELKSSDKWMEFKIIVDTREQLPLKFENSINKCLNVGDYGAEINGVLLPVVFDRKSPPDALGTLVKGHERFKREIARANEQQIKLIMIVECSYTNFVKMQFSGAEHSILSPAILVKIVHSTMLNNNLEIVFCNDRKEMKLYITNHLELLAKRELKYNREAYGLKKIEK